MQIIHYIESHFYHYNNIDLHVQFKIQNGSSEDGNTSNNIIGPILPSAASMSGSVNPINGLNNQFQICSIPSPSPSQLLYSHWLASRNTNAIFGLQGNLPQIIFYHRLTIFRNSNLWGLVKILENLTLIENNCSLFVKIGRCKYIAQISFIAKHVKQ